MLFDFEIDWIIEGGDMKNCVYLHLILLYVDTIYILFNIFLAFN